ncbi:Helicase required for RNAi-mediated heterochromatin assembly 1 [Neonectria ditissima]|uniref:Helicase required for RNAi-mediated heterochromatin assembly 1 n=1 Tax=Neonectria ditissima TaxID=78410 RepID=A0A0P7BSH4_9HYPO|nr:Helicase required for RNAi-mediated heterochromatin assembly 1 [Neonectria ditissima]
MGGDQVSRDSSALDIIKAHVNHGQLKHAPQDEPGQGQAWRTSPEAPTAMELMATKPPSLPQVSSDTPPTKNEYLETQYWLNRFEGTELLRRAVNQVRRDPNMTEGNDFYIYTQVRVQGYTFARSGAACRIGFSTERSPSKVVWAQSGRLTAGTLIALSHRSDNFRTQCFVATVAARYLKGGLEPDPEAGENENTPPRIDIFWENHDDVLLDPSNDLIMIEAKGGYYKAVRYAMVGLQHAATSESKFDKYIIDGCTRSDTAKYVQTSQVDTTPNTLRQLDHSQIEAFKTMTSQELAIVQGPPGTGKTFTSIMAIRSYIQTLQARKGKDEPPSPIVISAQTNHALDQLLEQCIRSDANVVRLGGRSTVPCVAEHSLYKLVQDSKLHKGNSRKGENTRKAVLRKLKDALSMCFPGAFVSADHLHREGLLTQEQFNSLVNNEWETATSVNTDGTDDSFSGPIATWLEDSIEQDRTYVYHPPQGQTETPLDDCESENIQSPEDDELERLHGEFVSTEFYWTGSVTMANNSHLQACKLLRKHADLYNIKPPQRGMVYRCLRKQLIDKITEQFPRFLKEYQSACAEVTISANNHKVKVIQHEGVQVIGCTTTGLAIYRGLISATKPLVLMIEEAAETREANITSALYPSLDQVVLVGDHQQLVPHVDVSELEQYGLNKSLFERLVYENLPYSMLKVQRRMIPIIRSVVHTFYPELEDHESVHDRAPVPGMGGQNLWWFQHKWSEGQDDKSSCYNKKEAEMIVGFVKYLVQNGVRPSQITMLTYYKGQVTVILQELKKSATLAEFNPAKEWSVRTVDGFQGEENDIIILSLVRSSRAGFVENENRAIVSISRARRGMYIYGNSETLLNSTIRSRNTWQRVYDVFVKEKCIGYGLPVVCKNHNQVTSIVNPDDWSAIPGGGCQKSCGEKCSEGHSCKEVCHAVEHAQLKCTAPCERTLPCGHQCDSRCGYICKCSRNCNKPSIQAMGLVLPKQEAPQSGTISGTKGLQILAVRMPQAPEQRHESTSEDLIEFGECMRATDDHKWIQKVREGDRAMQLQRSRFSPGRASITIRQTFTPTTGSPTTSTRGEPVMIEHTFATEEPSTASSDGSRNEAISVMAEGVGHLCIDYLEEDLIQFD